MVTVRERKHRLPSSLYRGRTAITFTACLESKISFFNQMNVFSHLSQIIFESLTRCDCEAHVFLFMPDHCHLLIQGNTDNSDLLGFMKDFKQKSGYWFSKSTLEPMCSVTVASVKWQKDFYDHILRREDDIRKHVQYILENPMRKGLVNNWKEYPFKGSTIYSFEGW